MLLFRPTHLLVGDDGPAHTGWGLVVENGRIAAVGPLSDVAPRAGSARAHDLVGTLMPGMIDCHTHVCLSGGINPVADLKAEGHTRRTVRAIHALAAHRHAGVTTIRDMGGPGGLDLEIARGVREGWLEGPRMLAAGEVVCITGGHACFLGIEADGPDAVRAAVRKQLKSGCDLVKVIATGGVITPGVEPGAAQMTPEELRAACEEARKAGRLVAAHAQGTEGIRNALLAGVATIEHGFFLDAETIGLMLARGSTLVPTFAAGQAMLDGEAAGVPAYMIEKIKRVKGAHIASFQTALAAGVHVACGTDAGTPLNPHGRIATEVELLVRFGATPAQAVAAATGNAARAIGRDDIGLLREGRRADLLWVGGNPQEDVHALTKVRGVWMDGRHVEGPPPQAIPA